MKKIDLSIIIPVYNARDWIAPTLQHLDSALAFGGFNAEVIVIDDGSTDGGAKVARHVVMTESKTPITIIEQKNAGRYLARKAGIGKSRKDNILFIDSRVFCGKESLSFLHSKLQNNADQLWNGHVYIDKKGSIFTRFWDAIVCIAWRRYFSHPKETQYEIKDFDYYPKGTGFFYVPKKRLLAAMNHFEKTTNDIKHSSDDTLLIRFMNRYQPIHLSPEFNCLYHGRTNGKSFLKHAYHRGEFFIDGFLRPGTRFFLPLIGVLGISIAAVISLFISPLATSLVLLATMAFFAAVLLLGSVAIGIEWRDAVSLAVLGAPFAVCYLAGLWLGVARKLKGMLVVGKQAG